MNEEKIIVYAVWYRGFNDNGSPDIIVRPLGMFNDLEAASRYQADVINALEPDFANLRIWLTWVNSELVKPVEELKKEFSEWIKQRDEKFRNKFLDDEELFNTLEELKR